MPAARCEGYLAMFLLAPTLVAGDVSIVALGDWGGGSAGEPSTASQRETAIGLSRVAKELGADFALMMGDNFYKHGIENVNSPRLQQTFEMVYPPLLPDLPFYAMMGNHDYGENHPANVSAQLAYARQSTHWRLPFLWYKIQRAFVADGQPRLLEILVLDTIVLCGWEKMGDAQLDVVLAEVEPPADHGTVNGTRLRLAAKQWQWLQAQLEASRADYLWVTGHFPIWSAGRDGPVQCLVERLQPLLARHGAHYISGHDHNLEHIHYAGVHALVVGAGKMCCYPKVHAHVLPEGALHHITSGKHGLESWPTAPFPVLGGFASLRFGAEAAEVALHAHDGAVLHRLPRLYRRGHGELEKAALEELQLAAVKVGVVAIAFFAGAIFAVGMVAVTRRGRRAAVEQRSLLG